MKRRVLILAVFGLVLALSAGAATAANRLALVIGNDAYVEVPALRTAGNDADAMAAALDAQGFGVVSVTDGTRRQMNRAISEFVSRLRPGDTAIVFFAGHGVEIGGENYLLPTDIVAPASGDGAFVASESIALSRLLDRVRATGARTTIAIIDACRENPFAASTGRSIGGTRGLARITAPEGTFVIFSAGAGQLALDRLSDDDPDPNSVFTRTLLPRLSEPGLELRDLVSEVRLEVRDIALTRNHAQFPAYYDELLGDFYLVAAPRTAPRAEGPGEAAPGSVRRDFALAREIGTARALEAFVEKHAGSGDTFALALAREILAALGPPDAPAPQPDPLPQSSVPQSPLPQSPLPQSPVEAVVDTRAVLRETQDQLNRLGCNAGLADGIAGPRTRAAFARFLDAGGVRDLSADQLGSPEALAALRAWSGRACAAPAAPVAEAPAATPQAPAALDLAGTWRYSAQCPLFIRVTGTARLRKTGQNSYSGTLSDSLGQSGTTTMRVLGRTIRGRNDWGTIVETWTATLSRDGASYVSRSSTGCTSTVTRG